jgi:hypothetical protein
VTLRRQETVSPFGNVRNDHLGARNTIQVATPDPDCYFFGSGIKVTLT